MNRDDEISEEGKQARFARWEEIGVDAIKADLLAGGHQLVGGPPSVRKLGNGSATRRPNCAQSLNSFS